MWIRKCSGEFQVFVVDEPMMVDDYEKRPLIIDAQMMIINKCGKEIEKKRIKAGQRDSTSAPFVIYK